jgi:hypothetical protein
MHESGVAKKTREGSLPLETREPKLNQADAPPASRYEKPRIEWEQELDVRTLSIGCAKFDPFFPGCASGISS